jgi:hypothetical protein
MITTTLTLIANRLKCSAGRSRIDYLVIISVSGYDYIAGYNSQRFEHHMKAIRG